MGITATEVAVVPELVRGIDGWGTPLEPGRPGVGITPIPVPVPVSVTLGRIEPRPLVRPPTTEPSRLSLELLGLAVGDTAGTLTETVEDPVGVVVDSAEGIEMPRLSRRPPWEVAASVDVGLLPLESVAVAVVLVFVAAGLEAPRRLDTSEPTAPRRESPVAVAAAEVAVLNAALLALELEPVVWAVEAEEVVLVDPRPSRLETSEPTAPRMESPVGVAALDVLALAVAAELSFGALVSDMAAVLVVDVGCAAGIISVEVVKV